MNMVVVDWIRRPVQRLKPNINTYAKLGLCSKIKGILYAVGGEEALQMFRSGCFGHFLNFKDGSSANKALHALMAREVRIPDAENERWFHVNGTNIRFGPLEYALVTGLRFGGSSFDPNADHPIPERGIFYRVFEGKRTTIAQMSKRFFAQKLTKSSADYVKVANILFVYEMLFCIDSVRAIDSWVWTLVEDVERWNSFPWGAYSFLMFMHFINLVPKSRAAMSGIDPGTYHFFGPLWALQTWAYEVIPQMGRQCAVPSGQIMRPRCLRWSFLRVVVDFSTFFDEQLDPLVPMMPTPEELMTPYYQSVQEGNIFGVTYIVLRKPSKKKTLGALASQVLQVPMTCVETAAVGPSRPQRSRRQRDPHSARGLVDEPDEIVEEIAETPDQRDLDHRASDQRAPPVDPSTARDQSQPRSSEEKEMPGRRPGESYDSWFDRLAQRVAHHMRGMIDETVVYHIRHFVDVMVTRLGPCRCRLSIPVASEQARQPTKSRHNTKQPSMSHHSVRQSAQSHHSVRQPTQSHHSPLHPTGSHQSYHSALHPTRSHHSVRQPTQSHHSPHPTGSQ
ncbi:hypothetical protein C2S52_015786 [Perilla frutescens var. hirtella]|nr:hypothetical protein C2S52_015786 [Perilla frutescens var. hirtella]